MENTKENNTKRKEKKYYDLLVSNGDNVAILSIFISIAEFLAAFNSFTELKIGRCFFWIISSIATFMIGFLIARICLCMSEMAKSSEKQTELLEKQIELLEKLDK